LFRIFSTDLTIAFVRNYMRGSEFWTEGNDDVSNELKKRMSEAVQTAICKRIAQTARQDAYTRWKRLTAEAVAGTLKNDVKRGLMRTCVPAARAAAEGRDPADDTGDLSEDEDEVCVKNEKEGTRARSEQQVTVDLVNLSSDGEKRQEDDSTPLTDRDVIRGGGVWKNGVVYKVVPASAGGSSTRGGATRGGTARGGTPKGGTSRGGTPRGRGRRGGAQRGGRQAPPKPTPKQTRRSNVPGTK
jgi:hypothetical protein